MDAPRDFSLRFRLLVAGLVAPGLVLILVVSLGPFVYWGQRTDGPADEMIAPVQRNKYPLRHWLWSGIFPIYGGFVPDPHFKHSLRMPLPQPLQGQWGIRAEFQIVEVNSGFDDRTSEIVLLLKTDAGAKAYQLAFERGQNVVAILATPDLPAARLIPFSGQTALLVRFLNQEGVYLIPARTSPDPLPFFGAESPVFRSVASRFRDSCAAPSIKEQFCETRRRDFIAFYEKFCAPCAEQTKDAPEVDTAYNEFWHKRH